jgi:hypothetical protein
VREAIFAALTDLIRESFEGARPGEGTAYLDKDGGIRQTLSRLTAAQASKSRNGHPGIAAHARHMAFHLRVTAEWIQGDHSKRDWIGSFQPYEVNEAEWQEIQADLERARQQMLAAHAALDDATFVEEGAGYGALAHLAYHLGAIRQLVHDV